MVRSNRLLSRFALLEKIKDFCADLLGNFASISEDVIFIDKESSSSQKDEMTDYVEFSNVSE
jgi:hypothetical protein